MIKLFIAIALIFAGGLGTSDNMHINIGMIVVGLFILFWMAPKNGKGSGGGFDFDDFGDD